MSAPLRRPAAAPILLALLPCLLFHRIFMGGCLLPANLLKDVYPWRTGNPRDLVPWNVLQFDGITQFYPWRLFAAETWRSGFVPLWNPHQFCGTPFLANGQSAVLYPPNMIFLIMPPAYAFGWSDVLHLAFTGVSAYLFFRRAGGASRWASAVGAACWQLSTWQVSWMALPTFLDTSAWLPSALLAVYGLARRPTVERAVGLAIVLAMTVLAGHLQISFYCIGMTAAYGVLQVFDKSIPWRLWTKSLAVTAGVAFLLVAAQLLPTIELSRQSHRAGAVASAAGYRAYISLATPIQQTAALFVPGFFGHPQQGTYWGFTNYAENAGYIGAAGLMFAFIGLWSEQGGRQRLFFAASAAFALAIAVGSPLNEALYYGIPGFAQTGSPARILVLWTLCTAFLAALGVDATVQKTRGAGRGAVLYCAVAAVICLGSVGGILKLNPRLLPLVLGAALDFQLWFAIVVATCAIFYLRSRSILTATPASLLIFAVVALDLFVVNYGYNPVVRRKEIYPVTPLISYLQRTAGNDRIMPVNRYWSIVRPPFAVLPPNGATVYGLYDLQGYDSLQTKQYKQFSNTLDGADSSPEENGNMVFVNCIGSEYAEAADARFVVSLRPVAGLGEPVAGDGRALVYVDTNARAIGGGAALIGQSATRMTFVSPRDFDASIQWYPGWREYQSTSGTSKPGESEFRDEVAPTQPSALAPFTHVRVDLSPRVELRFQPDSFLVGLYLTLIGCAIVAMVSAARCRANSEVS